MPTHVAIISPMYSSSSSTKSMSLIQKSLKDIVNAIIECSTWHQLQSVSVLMTEGEEDRLRLLSQLKKCSPTRNLTISTPLVSQLTRNDVGEEVLVLQGIEPNPSSSVSTITSSSSSSSSSSSLQVYLLTPQFHGKSLITQFRERVPGHSLTYLSDLFPDPDLLIVPYPILTLHGYPPWQLRLTEIYYEKGLSRLSLGLLRRSLKRYQKVQHRYGR
ncbi:hypothetical protein HMI54_013710 [Coelomomyces lativittatus]|nr:hypothetical protein HMI55_001377 [Coelomomyces lativittatus]KAJ1514701.1 hypothetical protein HMI54_013710 [Coelomomyces lativittatus]